MLNGLIVILLIASILFLRRGNSDSTRLNLRKSSDRIPQATGGEGPLSGLNNMSENGDKADGARSLNVVFQFEGNWYDAFEILDIPAGTSLAQARERFNELLKSVSTSRHELIKEAIKAIAASVSK